MQFEAFDLNLLRALDTLLRERNVTRSAQMLNVTQQAMSGSLKRLRERFDDELLIRVGRRLELTPLGAALVVPVRELMQQIMLTLETTPVFDPRQVRRHFRIAMSDYATVTILPHLMAQISDRAPGLVCEIQLIGDTVYRDLEDGKLDFCVLPSNWRLYQDSKPQGIRSVALYRDDFVCVVDANNTAVGETLTLDEYLALPHNVVKLGGNVRSIVEQAWITHQLSPRVVATTTSFASLVFMIAGTSMVATAQRRLALKFARMLPIRILECPIAIEPLQADLSWHVRHNDDPAHHFLREAFAAAGAEMAADPQA